MSKQAKSPDDVPMKFLVCRAFRHEFKFVTDHVTYGPHGKIIEFTRVSKCTNCTTVTTVSYSTGDWRPKKRTYDRPDLYSVKGGYNVYDARDDYIKARFS